MPTIYHHHHHHHISPDLINILMKSADEKMKDAPEVVFTVLGRFCSSDKLDFEIFIKSILETSDCEKITNKIRCEEDTDNECIGLQIEILDTIQMHQAYFGSCRFCECFMCP